MQIPDTTPTRHGSVNSRRLLRSVTAFLVVAAASSSGTLAASAEDVSTFDLAGVLTEFVGDAKGGAVAVMVRDGEMTTSSIGDRSATGGPLSIDTPFRVASISKTFVATMVMQLVDEGMVDLDESLSTYLPDAAVGRDVRVRSLLGHRSGIPNFTDQQRFWDDTYADLGHTFTANEVLGYIADVPASAPDVRWHYSNTNYLLLGQLIEAVAGADIGTVLRTRVAEPLGLQATLFPSPDSPLPEGLAMPLTGIYADDPTAPYQSISSAAWAAGAVISSAEDLAAFMVALFGGELLSDDSLADMIDLGPEGYGFGLASTELWVGDFGSATDYYGHNGGIDGFSSSMAIDPTTGDLFVVLTNTRRDTNADAVASDILAEWAAGDR
jgi:D-alanyl-D-alanine carboxypeptidase